MEHKMEELATGYFAKMSKRKVKNSNRELIKGWFPGFERFLERCLKSYGTDFSLGVGCGTPNSNGSKNAPA